MKTNLLEPVFSYIFRRISKFSKKLCLDEEFWGEILLKVVTWEFPILVSFVCVNKKGYPKILQNFELLQIIMVNPYQNLERDESTSHSYFAEVEFWWWTQGTIISRKFTPPIRSSSALSLVKPVKLDFPRFSGEDPASWVYKAKQYFGYYQTPNAERLVIASFHMNPAHEV